jgi:hypothetical protein
VVRCLGEQERAFLSLPFARSPGVHTPVPAISKLPIVTLATGSVQQNLALQEESGNAPFPASIMVVLDAGSGGRPHVRDAQDVDDL